jgi:thiamine biosynthesis lipoprotein
MASAIARRRFIGISAAAAGMALLPLRARAAFPAPGAAPLRSWSGAALGADARLLIHHPDPARAERLIARCLDEVARLERVFSLYREDSALVRLNRDGALAEPPLDLVRLLGESERFSRLTGGAFDVTVQPLWRLYADHFSRQSADPAGPPSAAIDAALARVGHGGVDVSPARIRFTRPGMAITLNGIAQGYITDRVVDLLRGEGIERALVDMGEIRATGDAPWSVGLEDPILPGSVADTLRIENRAVATSGGYGTRFDAAGRFNHLFEPGTGTTSARYLAVSVVAAEATAADALSTAFSLLPLRETMPIVRRLGLAAHFALPDGSRISQKA